MCLNFGVQIIILFSFSKTESIIKFTEFTFKWYLSLIKDTGLIQSLIHSIQVSLIAVFVAVVIGTTGAFFLNRLNFPGKGLYMTICQLPFVLPGIIVGIALLLFFINLNISLSMFTIIVGHVAFTTPVVMFQINSRLQRMGKTYEEAAHDLGATTIKTFFFVTLPMIKTAIIGASLLAFTISFDEIILTYFLTGTWTTLPVYIYGMLRFGLSPQVYAISAIILVFSIILIFFIAKFSESKIEVISK